MASKFELYYGEPGSGKTRSLLELIKAVAEAGKKSRVYTGDGSKMMYEMSGMAAAGGPIASLIDFTIRDYPFTTCQQITEGYLPVDPDDPASKMAKLTPQAMGETGLWIFEGAAVMGNYMMGDAKGGLAQRAADGEVIGQATDHIKITDGPGMSFGGNAGAHYNLGQRHLLQDVLRSKAFPGIVVWTTHERMDDGERGGGFVKGSTADKVKLGDKVIGPEMIGKALTSSIGREFGNTLHFVVASKKVTDGTDPISGKTTYREKADYRVYTRNHYDPDGIVALPYRAISRSINPAMIKDFYSSEQPGTALIDFYRDLELANKL